jgi:hypothetical protein
MTITQSDWKTRLGVRFTVDGNETRVFLAQSYVPTFGTSAEPLHSIERTHVGVVETPQSLTFTLSVTAIGPAAAELTALALRGDPFDIVLLEQEGNDWSFSTIVLERCYITSAAPGSATVSGAPVATFSGFSLAAAATDIAGTTTKAPH